MHKETIYGKRKAPEQEEAYHVRKPIDNLTTKKHIEKVVDPIIKKLIYSRIKDIGGFEQGDKIPSNTFFITDEIGKKIPQIFLPNKHGEPVPVKKIRMKENIGGAEQLKEDINQYVNPRNNHHVLIYKDFDGNLKEEVVTFWTAVQRKINGKKIVQLPEDGREIVTTLQINDMFLLGVNEGNLNLQNQEQYNLSIKLYKVEALSSKYYEFRLNTEASESREYAPYYIRIQSFGKGKTGWQTFNPIKVKVSPTGKISKRI
ncbi:MAG: hypothetical protein JXR46_12000 [Calditrichaceae bacterium]|nr:hypothetical protein [Calditrichaceae bacterium]MBN2709758.1 hypothetical protein [Calditrichaceae bacterium]RQV94952.1 MAG: hypothetical protein EH224_08750 [Calditrichota bacterium]